MEWYRAYHGACSDAKWPIVARKAKVSVGVVVSVWFAPLESASQASERGSVENFDPETVDALYGYEDGTTAAVFSAMLEKGLICDGRICAWDKRQPKREREDNSAARVRQSREKQRRETQTEATEAQDSASVTPCNSSVTPCNASVTPPEQNREEQTREEDNTPHTPQGGDSVGRRSTRFTPPSPDEVQRYCDERHNGIVGSEFCDFYASKGWMIGKAKMKDWKAAIRTWERKRQEIREAAQDKFAGAI